MNGGQRSSDFFACVLLGAFVTAFLPLFLFCLPLAALGWLLGRLLDQLEKHRDK